MPFKFNALLRAMLAGSAGAQTPAFTVTLDNLVNLTGGGTTNVFMTGSSGGNGVITAKASASRLTGVAPLYVNIDMTDTTSTISSNPSHELFFSINWGDPGAGQWTNGVQSAGLTDKNWSFGPVGGHVFETPGTYVVTPTATDGVNTANRTKTIVVLDPNVVYDPAYGAGYETICISNSNNFTGAPGTSGLPGVATYINRPGDTDMTAAWNFYKASNKRILFCKADAWTCSAVISVNALSNVILGGYGTGVSATFGSGTMVSVTPSALNGSMFSVEAGSSDIKICNFKIASNPTTFAFVVNGSISSVLSYKIEIRGCAQGFNAFNGVGGVNNVMDQLCLYECLVDELYGMPFIDTTGIAASFDATTDAFTATAHGYAINAPVKLRDVDPVTLPNAVPTPLVGNMGAQYYISATGYTADTFKLSATSGGAVLDLTSTGSCVVAIPELHGGVGAFVSLVRGGMMGCYIDTCNKGEQTVRFPYLSRAHINNNYFARPNQAKNILKVNSFIHSEIALWCEKFVISGNELDLRGGYSYGNALGALSTANPTFIATDVAIGSMTIGSGGNGGVGGEWVRNVIVESNITRQCLGNPKGYHRFIEANCPNMTIRNNIADMSVGDRSSSYTNLYPYTQMHFATVVSSTADTTIGVRIYNNTMYSNIYNTEVASFVRVQDSTPNTNPDDVKVIGNIWYYPNRTNTSHREAIYNQGTVGTNIYSANNTDTANTSLVSPLFAATPPVALTDWKPTAGSYAIAGIGSPITLRDFNNATRVGTFNHMGAVLP